LEVAIVEPARPAELSLVAGVLALDFANTASGRDSGHPFEHLRGAGNVVDWAGHAGVISAVAATRARAAIAADSEMADRILRQAVQLRGAIYGIGSAIAHGRDAPDADLKLLKDFARRALGPAELARTPGGVYGFDFTAAPIEFALLGSVAWSALDFLSTGRFDRLKQCPGEDCGWLFFDSSKNNSRRWCDMATCGNRTKARKHRERH
jgi:predicted RNA-binding Zn ribbon-like protein